MIDLEQIKATPKTGKEILTDDGLDIKYNLMDFWSWSVSDLLVNTTRGRFAEFIVGTAAGLNPKDLREEWDPFDLKTSKGIKIEVKSSAYIQSWNQNTFSKVLFSIKPARHWDDKLSIQRGKAKRHADIYVFCLLKHQEQSTIDPLCMEQWEFYVLPTFKLDNYKRSQSSITLNSLEKLTRKLRYRELQNEMDNAYSEQKNNKMKTDITN